MKGSGALEEAVGRGSRWRWTARATEDTAVQVALGWGTWHSLGPFYRRCARGTKSQCPKERNYKWQSLRLALSPS